MFSVIIPVYNSQETIELALESVLKQTRVDLVEEIIVIDDGSVDDSVRVIEEYKNSVTLPIKLIRQRNAGPAAARNAGIREAGAEYLAFLDSDDTWEKDKIEKQYSVIVENPDADLICGGFSNQPLRILFRKYDGLHKVTLKEYCWKSFIFTSTVVIHRKHLSEAGLFNEDMKYAEDMNFYQRFFRWEGVYYLPEKMAEYGVGRDFYGQSGLSSNLLKMHRGRKFNFDCLKSEGMITFKFYILMVLFGDIKYIRRSFLVWNKKRKVRRERL